MLDIFAIWRVFKFCSLIMKGMMNVNISLPFSLWYHNVQSIITHPTNLSMNDNYNFKGKNKIAFTFLFTFFAFSVCIYLMVNTPHVLAYCPVWTSLAMSSHGPQHACHFFFYFLGHLHFFQSRFWVICESPVH